MEKETNQGNEVVKIWCGCDQFYLWKSQGMCWQGKRHLGTLKVSLRDFDEELCLGFSADDSVPRLDKNEDLALEMSDLTELLGSEFLAVKGKLPAMPTLLKSTAFPLGLENFGINPWSVLGMTLNSSVVVLSTTLNSCGAIKEMILWVLLQSALLQSAPLHSWFSFLVVPDLLCS